MEEEIDKMEQPEMLTNENLADCDGSIGKFKNENELKKAYESLEAEFTRKSQKLKELERMVDSIKNEKNKEEKEVFLSEDWPNEIANFTAKNKYAQNFAEEISAEILSDKLLQKSKSPLEDAYARVVARKYVPEQELAIEESFLNEYVLNNPKIQKKIIENFVKEKQTDVVPKLISKGANSFAVSKIYKPKTFEEAKDEAFKLF